MRHSSLQKIGSTEGSWIPLRNLGPALRGGMNDLEPFRVEIPILGVRFQLLEKLEESASGFLWKTARIEMLVELSPMRDFLVKPAIGDRLFEFDNAFEKPLCVREFHSPDRAT